VSAENFRKIISSTFARAAFATSSLGEVNITRTLARFASATEARKKALLVIAHRAAAARLRENVIRDTERFNEHRVMEANLSGIPFRQQRKITQDQQNISPDQPQDRS